MGDDSYSYSDSDSDAHTDDTFWNEDSEDDQDGPWVLDSVRLFREQQDSDLPAELAGGPVKAVELDAMFGYGVRPDPRMPGFALGPAEEAPVEEEQDADANDEDTGEVDPDFYPPGAAGGDPDDDVTMRDPPPTSRKRKAPPAPRPKRRRKTKASPIEPVLSEYELGRRAKIKRNNKFLVSVGLLFPPKDALADDEHPWWYMTAR